MKKTLSAALVVLLAAAVYVTGILQGWYGKLEEAGTISVSEPRAAAVTQLDDERQRQGASGLGADTGKQILFGDLHVHTTFSSDAFRMSLPMVQGDGSHPPADACDFARICSRLDFWALTDHAESLTPELWRRSVASVQQCDAIAGDPSNPDMVTFLGYEWTQSGATPDTHYGHKNVIFRDVATERLPARPVSSPVRGGTFASIPARLRVLPPLRDLANRQRYYDFGRLISAIAEVPACDGRLASPDLPADCYETAATPADLFRILREWQLPALVIPHGTAWGVYSPPGTSLDKQLAGNMHDPTRQTLIEVYSGHGASEVYRDWEDVRRGEDGSLECPEPTEAYLPSCWRAGEIIYERCIESGLSSAECESRAADARQRYMAFGLSGWHTVPGTRLEDWLDAGQCRDCYLPAFNYRPRGSAQYGLAISNFDGDTVGHTVGDTVGDTAGDTARRFRFGFIASSDNHSARPGTGYKEYARNPMVDWWGYRGVASRALYSTDRGAPAAESRDIDVSKIDLFNILELERQASYFSTGGLVAAHAAGRDRASVWDALERKEVYGTSGERMLLWFDLTNAPEGRVPMGGETRLVENPRFVVRALGSFVQKPGCPDWALRAAGPEQIERLCRGECYHPGDERKRIERIEIVRIRPQQHAGEPVARLIEDPWKTLVCTDSAEACRFEFEDGDFRDAGRDAVYYARVIQEARPTINAGGLRCEYDDAGRCVSVRACFGDDRTDADDDCVEPLPSVAWSSPIFVDFGEIE